MTDIKFTQKLTHVIQAPVPTVETVHQWDHLTIVASVLPATLGLPARWTLMNVCQQFVLPTAGVQMPSTRTHVSAILDMKEMSAHQ